MELEDAGFSVLEAGDGQEAWNRFVESRPDLVITDMKMPHSDGMELLSRIRSRSETPVIMFTAYGTVDTAVSALKAGANEFVSSVDANVDELVDMVRGTLIDGEGNETLPDLESRLVGSTRAMLRVREQVTGLAPLGTPVLVSGESGTGRDTTVGALHSLGATAGGELVRVDAAAFEPGDWIPDSGAVYLDDVDRLTPEAQAYWADRVAHVRSDTPPTGVRLFASTTDSIATLVQQNGFSKELGEVLIRFEIDLPPLRDRREDIPAIASILVDRIGRRLGRPVVLSAAANEYLQTQRWPGNVAELENVLEKVIAFSRAKEIRRQAIDDVLQDVEESVAGIRDRRDAQERDALLNAIEVAGGNVTRAAEILGKSRTAVYYLISKHGIRLNRGR